MTHDEILTLLYEETLVGNAPAVSDGVNQGLELGMDPGSMLYDALIPSLEEVGARFERGDYFVPEMLIAARAMQGALDILRPLLAETGAKPIGTFVMGLAIGAGLALLLAPRTGEETRRDLQRRARKIGDQAQDLVSEVTESVSNTLHAAKDRVESSIDSTRSAVEIKRRQVTNAVHAGRAAAQQARVELEQRIAETKAAYKEG